ncbi:uncharacterized protein LOC124913158 [Impatiens glandulifera]|uniref:uncharacterized protein LOC124913158 n=1 Tax=Impatiens glandulifera TaxID=253017 RepID=UPI001FB0877C|nr:uncharacterized protein LOC124913158 [Impatiens glandulifera]
MEFFTKARAIKLRSHNNKYLVADDDQKTIRQSRNSSSTKSRWIIELVEGGSSIRLKSCHGFYLTATSESFLLGMTGNKVIQSQPDSLKELPIEWTPKRVGPKVELRSFGGKCLRANGGPPPWRNSVTHDEPHMNSTLNWVLWDVEPIEVPENGSMKEYLSMMSTVSSVSDDLLSELGSPVSPRSNYNSPRPSFMEKNSHRFSINKAINLFENAKAVRLLSHHGKYLHADEDQESITQDRDGSSKTARWTVEFVPGADKVIRLRSYNNKYLTASNIPFLRGLSGRKVVLTVPHRLDSSVEWEPIHEGNKVKLRTRYGQFLRANNGLPHWRNSVTHDIPRRTSTQGWILWSVDILEILPKSTRPQEISNNETPSTKIQEQEQEQEQAQAKTQAQVKIVDGRTIYYKIADESGNIEDEVEEMCFTFRGNGVEDLSRQLEEEIGIEDLIVCSRNPLNGKLFPLMLQLPPASVVLHLIVVPADSKVGRDLERRGMVL